MTTKATQFTCFVLLFLSTSLLAQSPHVISVSPAPQSMKATLQPEIFIQFDSPIDRASLTAKTFSVFGRWTGVITGTFELENDGRQIRFRPNKKLSAGEWVSVSLSKKIQGQNGTRLPVGFSWNFWTQSGKASLDLVETARITVRNSGEQQIRTYGAYAGDLNGDGFHDFTVPNEDISDIRVFLNDGAGGYRDFTTYTLPANSKPSTNEGADFNSDGWLDFVVGNIDGNSLSVLFGDGQGGFSTITTYPAGSGVRGLGVLDANSDGAPDIVTANRVSNNASLFLNNGDGTISSAQNFETGGNGETSCAIADANNDGISDIFIGCRLSQEIVLLLGDGQGKFTQSAKVACGGDAWMIAAGDVNNDGQVDVVSANAGQNQFSVMLGNGLGGLEVAVLYFTGSFPLAIDLGDLDGDGDLDLVTSNYSSQDWRLFENDGSGRFVSSKRLLASTAGSCAVFHDRDLDGDLDMTGIDEEDDLLFLFENPGSPTAIGDFAPAENNKIPDDFVLLQSYPNPFSKQASQLPSGAAQIEIPFFIKQNNNLRLAIYNIRGELIEVATHADFASGSHVIRYDATALSPGIYFYLLRAGSRQASRKFVVIE